MYQQGINKNINISLSRTVNPLLFTHTHTHAHTCSHLGFVAIFSGVFKCYFMATFLHGLICSVSWTFVDVLNLNFLTYDQQIRIRTRNKFYIILKWPSLWILSHHNHSTAQHKTSVSILLIQNFLNMYLYKYIQQHSIDLYMYIQTVATHIEANSWKSTFDP